MDRTSEQIKQAYLSLYLAADTKTKLQGRLWYPTATATAKEIAQTFAIDWRYVAKTIAALSPRQHWKRNIQLTWDMCAGREVKTIEAFKKTGYACLEGKARALKGPKTRSFASAILGYRQACTIDTWMIKAAGFNKKKLKVKEFKACKRALYDLASELGEDARDLQAIIWIQIRGKAN